MSSLTLDTSTLLIIISVLAFLMAAVSLSFDDVWTTDHFGLSEWGNAMAAAGASCLLFYLRGHVPWFLSFLLGNVLVLLVSPYAVLAHARLFGTVAPRRLLFGLLVFGLSGPVAVFFFDASRHVTAFTVGVTVAIQLGLVAVMIYRATLKQEAPVAWISCGMLTIVAMAFAGRAATSLLLIGTPVLPLVDSRPQAGTLMAAALFLVGTSIGFFSMVNERRLRDTLATMRKDELSGLLTQTALFSLSRDLDKSAGAQPFAVVLVPVVQFQLFKDTFGHSGGARALAHAGDLIAKTVRATDVAGRYGEHAFCIVLPGYGEAEAALFMSRLIALAAQTKVLLRDGREVSLTLTASSACRSMAPGADGRLETVHDVIDRAERASSVPKDDDWPQSALVSLPRLDSIAVV